MRIGIEALRRARSVYAAIWCGQGTRSEEDIENRIDNWTKSKWEADTFDYLKATRLARTLRDFDLVVSIVKAAYRKP